MAIALVAVGLLLGACKSNNGGSPSLGTLTPRASTTTTTTTDAPVGVAAGAYAFSRSTTNHTVGSFQKAPIDKTTNTTGTLNVAYTIGRNGQQYVFTREGTSKFDQILRYESGATELSAWHIAQNGNSVRFLPTPPVTLFPAGVAVGSKWNWTVTSVPGSGARQKRSASFEAVRTEDLMIGGVTVSCIVVNGVTTVESANTGTIKTTDWYSPLLKLVVQENQITDFRVVGKNKDLQVHLDQTTKLVDSRPNHV